jgi:hypothetical protein
MPLYPYIRPLFCIWHVSLARNTLHNRILVPDFLFRLRCTPLLIKQAACICKQHRRYHAAKQQTDDRQDSGCIHKKLP